MREPSANKRQRLLEEAYAQGIRHFDVARMYGLGAAEAELGRFTQSRRDDVVIVTKFGIEAKGSPGRLARVQGPARSLLARYPALRGYVKRRSQTFHQSHRYDAATARMSLQTSLRELRTDYVDVLLVHDPSPTDAVDVEELRDYLEMARQEGHIRAWGVAGERVPCRELGHALGGEAVLQLRDDVFSRPTPLPDKPVPLITFGVLQPALERIAAHFKADPRRRAGWSQELGVDCASPRAIVSLLIRDALRANSGGVVLYSTRRPERLRELAGLDTHAPGTDDPALAAFRRLVGSELGDGSTA
jgi:D-threo-aldose 1-dehydrogenase